MAPQRLFILFTLLASVAFTLADDTQIGSRVHGDYLLKQENISKPWSWDGWSTADKTYSANGRNITFVRATDLDKNGAVATFLAGGPGFTYVTMHFQSQLYKGFNFLVEIYGR